MSEEKTPFLKETVKDEQITGKKIGRAVCQSIAKGLIFGVATCLAFCVVKPYVEDYFAKEEEAISFPKDDVKDEEEEAEPAEESLTLTVENYREMNKALYEVAKEARNCVVEIKLKDTDSDWKDEEKSKSVSGIIIWNKGSDILMLAPYGDLSSQSEIRVRFADDTEYDAEVKILDKNLKFAVFTVEKSKMNPETLGKIKTAKLGNSYLLGKGDSVIALGMPFGYSDGMGYGVVSSVDHAVTVADHRYQIMMTDIAAASQGSGVLFNVDGEVIGIVDQKYTNITDADLVSGYSISEIKSEIEYLSNGEAIPYLGIVSVEVTDEISEKEGIPMGLYVKEVEAESPAMEAGIQCGDVVVQMNGKEILSQKVYSKELMQMHGGDTATILVKRKGTEAYEEIPLEAVVGSKK